MRYPLRMFLNESRAHFGNREHQQCLTDFSTRLNYYLSQHPELHYNLIIDANVDEEDNASKRVNIVIEDTTDGSTPVLIEICASSMQAEVAEKLRILQLSMSGIKEIFVYDYQHGTWNGQPPGFASYSSYIGADLNTFI